MKVCFTVGLLLSLKLARSIEAQFPPIGSLPENIPEAFEAGFPVDVEEVENGDNGCFARHDELKECLAEFREELLNGLDGCFGCDTSKSLADALVSGNLSIDRFKQQVCEITGSEQCMESCGSCYREKMNVALCEWQCDNLQLEDFPERPKKPLPLPSVVDQERCAEFLIETRECMAQASQSSGNEISLPACMECMSGAGLNMATTTIESILSPSFQHEICQVSLDCEEACGSCIAPAEAHGKCLLGCSPEGDVEVPFPDIDTDLVPKMEHCHAELERAHICLADNGQDPDGIHSVVEECIMCHADATVLSLDKLAVGISTDSLHKFLCPKQGDCESECSNQCYKQVQGAVSCMLECDDSPVPTDENVSQKPTIESLNWNIREVICMGGSQCPKKCEEPIGAIEQCFGKNVAGLTECIECILPEEKVHKIEEGAISGQSCRPTQTCREQCGPCIKIAAEISRCAWGCEGPNPEELPYAPSVDPIFASNITDYLNGSMNVTNTSSFEYSEEGHGHDEDFPKFQTPLIFEEGINQERCQETMVETRECIEKVSEKDGFELSLSDCMECMSGAGLNMATTAIESILSSSFQEEICQLKVDCEEACGSCYEPATAHGKCLLGCNPDGHVEIPFPDFGGDLIPRLEGCQVELGEAEVCIRERSLQGDIFGIVESCVTCHMDASAVSLEKLAMGVSTNTLDNLLCSKVGDCERECSNECYTQIRAVVTCSLGCSEKRPFGPESGHEGDHDEPAFQNSPPFANQTSLPDGNSNATVSFEYGNTPTESGESEKNIPSNKVPNDPEDETEEEDSEEDEPDEESSSEEQLEEDSAVEGEEPQEETSEDDESEGDDTGKETSDEDAPVDEEAAEEDDNEEDTLDEEESSDTEPSIDKSDEVEPDFQQSLEKNTTGEIDEDVILVDIDNHTKAEGKNKTKEENQPHNETPTNKPVEPKEQPEPPQDKPAKQNRPKLAKFEQRVNVVLGGMSKLLNETEKEEYVAACQKFLRKKDKSALVEFVSQRLVERTPEKKKGGQQLRRILKSSGLQVETRVGSEEIEKPGETAIDLIQTEEEGFTEALKTDTSGSFQTLAVIEADPEPLPEESPSEVGADEPQTPEPPQTNAPEQAETPQTEEPPLPSATPDAPLPSTEPEAPTNTPETKNHDSKKNKNIIWYLIGSLFVCLTIALFFTKKLFGLGGKSDFEEDFANEESLLSSDQDSHFDSMEDDIFARTFD